MAKAQFPDKLECLFQPSRYKVLYGGRGSAKSWSIARALLILGAQRQLRILCARETQKSIADSVHALLKEQIEALGLQRFYQVLKSTIIGANGTSFIFFGLKHNVADIKSCEGVDIVWVEEAEAVSKGSWDTLIPTIRKDQSEIWISYNPKLETDQTHQRFAIKPPPGAVVVKMTFRDNPWFPEVLQQEMEHCKETRPDDYNHIWEGCCVSMLEGAIYANEMRAADKESRITRVPCDHTRPVHTFWDLGFGDRTSIWMVQAFPFEYRLIDFLEGSRQPLKYYVSELQKRSYLYGTDYLPHDARAKTLGTGRSIEELMREAGRRVQIVPMLSISDGINAARSIFPQCFFDAEKCADGIQALRHYRYGEIAKLGGPTREPLHDENSHAADAFRYFAVGIRPPVKQQKQQERTYHSSDAYSWMG